MELKLKYTKTIADLTTRWATGLITEPTGNKYIQANKDAIFSGVLPRDCAALPKKAEAFVVWAPGCHGTVALMNVALLKSTFFHNHRGAVAWSLHKCGVEVIEVESLNPQKARKLLAANVLKQTLRLKLATESKLLPAAEAELKWLKKCHDRYVEIIEAKKQP